MAFPCISTTWRSSREVLGSGFGPSEQFGGIFKHFTYWRSNRGALGTGLARRGEAWWNFQVFRRLGEAIARCTGAVLSQTETHRAEQVHQRIRIASIPRKAPAAACPPDAAPSRPPPADRGGARGGPTPLATFEHCGGAAEQPRRARERLGAVRRCLRNFRALR